MFAGYDLAAWLIGGTVLYVMYRRAVRLAEQENRDA